MSITTNVDINETFANALDVKDNGQAVQVPRGTTQLQWQLTGLAHDLQFYPIDDPTYPGFKWVDQPPQGTFTWPPTLLGNAKIIQMTDNNTAGGGPWKYQLNAHDSMGKRYSTYYVTPTLTTDNPQIKNN
jgi:hypothetical protein